jgi:hypothetical protein
MDTSTKLRVLLTIHKQENFIILKRFLRPNTGFARLRREGLITISKLNDKFYVTVSEKGEAFIALSLLDYKE